MAGFVASVLLSAFVWAQTSTLPEASSEPDAQALLERAKSALVMGDLEQAQLGYQLLLTTYPETLLKDQAYFGLAQIERLQQNHEGALAYYQKLLNEFPDSPLGDQARHEMAESYFQLGNYDTAIQLLERERSLESDLTARQSLTDRMVEVYLKKNDRVQAIAELLKREAADANEKQSTEDRIRSLLSDADPSELEDLFRTYPKGFPGDEALLALADQYESSRAYFEAERELRRFLSGYPRHASIPKVRSRIAAIRQRYLSHRNLIGALLPLSGRLKPFGQQVLNGVRLAIEQTADTVPEGFVDVVVKDTEGETNALTSGLDELVREYRVGAIIGPLLSRQVTAVGPRVEQQRVPILAPAASAEFSKSWKYVFRNSITNRQQALAIARYAVGSMGLRRFCILYSDDGYGREMMRIFSEEVAKLGGEIIAATSYDPQATDFGPQIRRLKEVDLTQYGFLGPPPTQKGRVREYKPGFDAIFLPGDYDQVGLIAAQLAFYDIQGVTLLGTSGWNSRELFRFGGPYIEGGIFVDGFFPDSADPAVRAFVERYRARYREEPTLLSAQAYDAAMMVLKALQQGATSGPAIHDFISQLQNFPGATGAIGFAADGELTKPLYVIQVKEGKFVQIN